MRNIFRNIRFSALKESKAGRYFVYAAGEIILIVLGIIIALHFSNRDENQKKKDLEIKLLKEFLTNLRLDSIDHQGNTDYYRMVETSAGIIVDQLEKQAEWHDSMAAHYPKLFMHGLATLNTSAYDNLESMGFDIITNDSVRIAITTHYKITYTIINSIEKEISADNMIQVMLPIFLKKIKMDIPWKHAVPLDYKSLLSDLEFREMVRWKKTSAGLMAGHYEKNSKKTVSLIKLIEAELQKLES